MFLTGADCFFIIFSYPIQWHPFLKKFRLVIKDAGPQDSVRRSGPANAKTNRQ